MRNVGRKLAFVLASTNHGTMIVNRLDYRMVGPDQGNSGVNPSRMWEFFVDNLILNSAKEPLKLAWNKRVYRKRTQGSTGL